MPWFIYNGRERKFVAADEFIPEEGEHTELLAYADRFETRDEAINICVDVSDTVVFISDENFTFEEESEDGNVDESMIPQTE